MDKVAVSPTAILEDSADCHVDSAAVPDDLSPVMQVVEDQPTTPNVSYSSLSV